MLSYKKPIYNTLRCTLFFSTSLLTVQYFLPMAIISVAYARIAFRLWGSKPPGAAVDERDHNILVNKKKVSISFSYSIYHTIGSSLFLGFIETSCFLLSSWFPFVVVEWLETLFWQQAFIPTKLEN